MNIKKLLSFFAIIAVTSCHVYAMETQDIFTEDDDPSFTIQIANNGSIAIKVKIIDETLLNYLNNNILSSIPYLVIDISDIRDTTDLQNLANALKKIETKDIAFFISNNPEVKNIFKETLSEKTLYGLYGPIDGNALDKATKDKQYRNK